MGLPSWASETRACFSSLLFSVLSQVVCIWSNRKPHQYGWNSAPYVTPQHKAIILALLVPLSTYYIQVSAVFRVKTLPNSIDLCVLLATCRILSLICAPFFHKSIFRLRVSSCSSFGKSKYQLLCCKVAVQQISIHIPGTGINWIHLKYSILDVRVLLKMDLFLRRW